MASEVIHFDALCIDSNILISEGFPVVSGSLDTVLRLAQHGDVITYIPELVLMETEAKWLQELDRKWAQVRSSLSQFGRHAPTEKLPKADDIDKERALTDYRDRAMATLERLRVVVLPTTGRPLPELLEMAAFHQAPFPEHDSAFRDAVILLSLADLLDKRGPPTNALLLSRDDYFKRIGKYPTAGGSTIHVEPDLVAAIELFAKSIAKKRVSAELARWRVEQQKVLELLRADLKGIEEFLRSSLDIPVGFSLFGSPRVIEVRGIQVGDVTRVNLPFPLEREINGVASISFDVTAQVEQVVERVLPFSRVPPANLRVGQTLDEESVEISPGPRTEERAVDVTVTVEATARLENDEYVAFEYVSAKLGQGGA